TAWYRRQPPAERARIGLYRLATFMKVGLQFENVLSQGLLRFALSRSERSPEQRYAYHELIEESHHSMMFAEFVRRTGFDIAGLSRGWARLDRVVVALGARFPELFFVFVLGGEDPIDHAQRLALAARDDLHPLVKRMSQIHITEEARHLCFARSFLREHVPKLSPAKRALLAVAAPGVLRLTADLMLRPSPELVREFAIPPDVVAAAFTSNPAYRAATLESLGKVRELMDELGLVTPRTERLWRALGAAA
ncbi:MAG TPA: diiron oxygenase, partial [Polyangia bacterium]